MNFSGRAIPVFLIVVVFAVILLLSGCQKEEGIVTPPSSHFDAEGLYLTARGDTIIYYFQGTLRAGDTIKAPSGNNLSPHYTLKFINANKEVISFPSTPGHGLSWAIAHNNIAEIYRDAGDEWDFHVRGKSAGTTTIVLKVLHGDHSDFITQPIPLKVDPSYVGEAAGVQILDEELGDTLVEATSSHLTGALTVRVDSTTDHRELFFLDDENISFQPPAPPHSLGITVLNPAIVEFIPAGSEEPWAFQIHGLQAGSTKVRFTLFNDTVSEFVSLDINVVVAP